MSDGAKQFAVLMTTVVGGLGPILLMTFGLIANGAANIIKLFFGMRKAFLGLGSSSQTLGSQTEYMTMQQLEAAAVAASLDQNHSKLIQTFTSEATVVDRLAAAYGRAVVQQSRLLGVNPETGGKGSIRAPRPKKYATGVLSVPGPKGAGDVVPAMLSPGEAVIPAKQASKYRGIVSSLIADNIPGFRFGLNPFASMLGRSRVATRMKSGNFMDALRSGGKDARYQSAFETQSGADYLTKYGLANPKQKQARANMERDIFGLDPKLTKGSARPTYGYAKTSILQSLINKIFGVKGSNFNALTRNPSQKSLSNYGDIDLITRSSVARRSTAYPNDMLMSYVRAGSRGKGFLQPAPMRGASSEQLKSFERLGMPFGSNLVSGTKNQYSVNPRSPYIETQTPGGFAFKEIDKVIARDKAIAKQLRKELSDAGLGGVRVVGPGFVSRLFKALGVPGYAKGVDSVPSMDFDQRATLQMSHMSGSVGQNLTRRQILEGFEKELQKGVKSGVFSRRGINPADLKAEFLEKLKKTPGDALRLYSNMVEPLSTMANQATANPDSLRMSGKQYLKEIRKMPKGLFGSGILSRLPKNHGIPDNQIKSYILNMQGSFESELKRSYGSIIKESDFHNIYQKAEDSAVRKIKDPGAKKLIKDANLLGRLGLTPAEAPGGASGSTRKYLSKLFGDVQDKTAKLHREGLLGKLFGPNFTKKLESTFLPQTKIRITRDLKNKIKPFLDSLPRKESMKFSNQLIKAAALPPDQRFTAMEELFKAKVAGRRYEIEQPKKRSLSRKTPLTPPRAASTEVSLSKILGVGDRFAKPQSVGKAGILRRLFGKSFNSGIVSVPGTRGAGDVVPAMLSPGEAVIPADMSRKYAPIIDGMISNSIPGYQDGTEAVSGRRQAIGKVAGAGGMLSMGGMMYGMSGAPGSDIANQISMPLMMLSMILPMVANPMGAVVAGLAAVAGALVFLKIKSDEATKSGFETAKAMSMTREKLDGLAEINNVVTSTQEAERQRQNQLTGESAKKRIYGQTFLESESGKSMLSSAETMTKSGKSNAEIAENFSNQLSYAVLQGSVTQEQAASIAAALGEKLQDYSITANIVGSLTALYGKNGENLLTDPLSISLRIQKETSAQQLAAFENAVAIGQKNSGITAGAARNYLAGGAMMAAGFVATLGSGGIAAPLSVPLIAAGAATMGGTAVAETFADTEENNKARAVAVQLGAEQIAQNQGLLDSLNDRYDSEIRELQLKKENAKTDEERLSLEGKINQKIAERDSAVAKQKEANDKIFDGLVAQAATMGTAFNESIGLSIDERFKGATGAMKAAADLAKNSLSQLPNLVDGKANTFKTTLQIGLASGELDPIVISNLIGADKDQKISKQFELLVSAQGTSEANQILQLATKAGIKSENYNVILNYFNKNPKTFKADQEALAQIANMGQEYGITVDLNVNGEKKLKRVSDFMAATGGLKGKPVTRKILTEYIEKNDMDAESKASLNEMLSNWDTLTGGDNKVNYSVLVDYAIGKANDNAIWAAYLTKHPELANATITIRAKYMPLARADFFGEGPGQDGGEDGEDGPGPGDGPGAGTRSEILDDLLKKLQNVRRAAINAKGGMTELMKLLKTRSNFTGFQGIEQQLDARKYNQEFIKFLADADAADQKRFMTIKNGVVTLKAEGKALQNLFSATTIGEYQRGVQESISASYMELDARKELLNVVGLTRDEAIEAARDSGIAEAIAAVKSSTAIKNKGKAIQEIINLYMKQKKAAEDAKTTEEQLNDLYDKAMDYFAPRIEKIEIDFSINTKSLQDIVSSAQGEIDTLINQVGGLDDLQAGLTRISYEEEKINKKYDLRLEALDKVATINDRILTAQKGQLTIADALSRGDISAAAIAAQEQRARESQDAIAIQRELLGNARESELGSINVDVNGIKLTRKEIEEKILIVEKQILNIEEARLEPARESIRLKEVEKAIALSSLESQKLEWEKVLNNARLTATAAWDYVEALKSAQSLLSKKPAASATSANRPPLGTITDASGFAGIFPQKNVTPFYNPLTGAITYKSKGGMVAPKYYAAGGFARGTDVIPAMLTPGEFVVKKYAVDNFGVDNLKAINNGSYQGSSVYNYNLSVNVSGASLDANDVARSVMTQIKQVDSQRLRGNRL